MHQIHSKIAAVPQFLFTPVRGLFGCAGSGTIAMSMTNIEGYADSYKSELFENVIPFWEEHSVDTAHGGYFTCLDRRGAHKRRE
jgi:hypothetical protein